MSTKAVSWVLHQVRVEPITKMILVTMAENADEYGVAWPSQATMAVSACVSLITVKRKLKVLEEAGVISVRRKRVGKHKTKNKYLLHLDQTFNLMGGGTVVLSSVDKMDPDFEGISQIPSKPAIDSIEGISQIPITVSQRDLQTVEGISSDTFKGISRDTRTTNKPLLTPSNNITTTAEHPVFNLPSFRAAVTMTVDWLPSDHVFDQLKTMRGIDRDYAMEQLPGFVNYHHASNGRQGSFDSRFLKHVIRNAEIENGKPQSAQTLPDDWEPSPETIQQLRTAGIDAETIWEYATSFAMYWGERAEARHSWNSMFYNSCLKFYRSKSQIDSLPAVDSGSVLERLGDRSWALS